MTNDLEGRFYAFLERSQQADPQWNRSVLESYVSMFASCTHVLDVGCGEGQFLQLLQERGIRASGVDRDSEMVRRCAEQGLAVAQEDAFSYLERQPATFDGIFCSNLVEHLGPSDVLGLLQGCLGALQPGGLLVVATPNACSAIVQLYEFWRDATHVRLYSPTLLRFLLDQVGFADVRCGENPRTVWAPPKEVEQAPKALEQLCLSIQASPRSQVSVLNPPVERATASGRGLVFRLRRSLARFLARTVLFEEFQTVERGLASLGAELDGNRSALTAALDVVGEYGTPLYRTYAQLLATPREVWVSGIKPHCDRSEAR